MAPMASQQRSPAMQAFIACTEVIIPERQESTGQADGTEVEVSCLTQRDR